MIERKIYNGWAYTQDSDEKHKINREIYKELISKYKILATNYHFFEAPTKEQLEEYDIIYARRDGYLHGDFRLYKAPKEITADELLLIFDDGNLCFGGSACGGYSVYED